MSIFEHARTKIFSPHQHPLMHDLSALGYTNPVAVGVTNINDALDYLYAAIYPRYIGTYATPAALPVSANQNDYAVVTNDGDGKQAGYVWLTFDGVSGWHKRFDIDWSVDGIMAGILDQTLPRFVAKDGHDDTDNTGTAFTGSLAGQHVYGGTTANSHLTLFANSGDSVGVHTGYVQVDDNFRPLADSAYSLGTTTERWLKIWTDEITSGTATLTGGSLTDSSGAISFDNENLTTTGTLASGTHTISTLVLAAASITDTSGAISFDNENLTTTGTLASGTHTIGTLVLAAASITDTSGSISFDNENLSTSGTLGAGVTTVSQLNVDDIRIDNNQISTVANNSNIAFLAHGTGVVDINSPLETLGVTTVGTFSVTGQIDVDSITLNGATISTGNNIHLNLSPGGAGDVVSTAKLMPSGGGSLDIGAAILAWKDIYFTGTLGNATQLFTNTELFSLRNVGFRDAARTQAVQAGDALFWDAVSGTWLASAPDSEINHETLSHLADAPTDDAGHTQFALLAGRSGGQTLIGGTASGDDLTLESTSHGTKGNIFFSSVPAPTTNASYSGGWSGTDLGDATHYFKDLYTKGEAKGLRLENYSTAGRPSASAQNPGRVIWDTDLYVIAVDTGGTWTEVDTSHWVSDTSWNGTDVTKTITVSTTISDARKVNWSLLDNTNGYEEIFASITATQTQVTITVDVPLPSGSYRLIGG